MGDTSGTFRKWLVVNSGPLLVVVGLALLGLAIWQSSLQALASTFAVLGAACIILGLLLDRLEGAIKVGPAGIELILRSIEDEASARGLDADQILEAVRIASEQLAETNYRILGPGSGKTRAIAEAVAHADAVAHAAVDQAVDERAFESIAVEMLKSVAESLGASISVQQVRGSVRFDAIIHNESRAVGVEIKNRFVPGERSLQGQIMLALQQSKRVDAILLLVNKEAVTSSELERARKAWLTPANKRWPIRILPWSPASGTEPVKRVLDRFLRVEP